MASLQFTERMSGQVALIPPGQLATVPNLDQEFTELLGASKEKKNLEFVVTIKIDNVDTFIADANTQAQATGQISSELYSKPRTLQKGLFNLFVRPAASGEINTCKEMHYRLEYEDESGNPLTLFGFKDLKKEDSLNVWKETTTLYYYILRGHNSASEIEPQEIVGIGILKIAVGDFLNQLTTFKVSDHSLISKSETFLKFIGLFSKNLWEAYSPFFFDSSRERSNDHPYPVNTTIGVSQGEIEMFLINTDDSISIGAYRFNAKPEVMSKKVVLLVHGLTLSTDMFMMPEHQNLVNQLHQDGFYDVWSLDWRGSRRFHYNLELNNYTVDDAAKYDVPAIINFIRKKLGEDVEISIICHCVGSMTVMSSVAAGYVTGIKAIVSNSVSLTPKTGVLALLKILLAPFFFDTVMGYPYISPKMPYMPGVRFGKWIYWFSRIFHSHCREPACHMLSIMWGWGFPVAYKHKNLSPITHRRLYDLFGGISFQYYRHIRKMFLRERLVSYSTEPKEIDYFELMKSKTDIPILLTSGAENLVFPQSNRETFEKLKEHLPLLKYIEIPGYGHQDVFMGVNSHFDYFPQIISFLKDPAKAGKK